MKTVILYGLALLLAVLSTAIWVMVFFVLPSHGTVISGSAAAYVIIITVIGYWASYMSLHMARLGGRINKENRRVIQSN